MVNLYIKKYSDPINFKESEHARGNCKGGQIDNPVNNRRL